MAVKIRDADDATATATDATNIAEAELDDSEIPINADGTPKQITWLNLKAYLREAFGVPVGGDESHVLTKASGDDNNDLEWASRDHPVSIWWGVNQSEALPTDNANLDADSAINTVGIKTFRGGTADQSEFGGVAVTWSDINHADNSDADLSGGSSAPNSVFEIPSGLYHLSGIFYGSQEPKSSVHLRLDSIQSGTDDIVIISGTPRQKDYLGLGANLHSEYDFKREFLRLTVATKFYVALFNASTAADERYLVGFVQIEKLE